MSADFYQIFKVSCNISKFTQLSKFKNYTQSLGISVELLGYPCWEYRKSSDELVQFGLEQLTCDRLS